MLTATEKQIRVRPRQQTEIKDIHGLQLEHAIEDCWKMISPAWPLNNINPMNPLHDMNDVSFETAWTKWQSFSRLAQDSQGLADLNEMTIKWCQVIYDEVTAEVSMPGREEGAYKAWRHLITFDEVLLNSRPEAVYLLKECPVDSQQAIAYCLSELDISPHNIKPFLEFLLVSLPGWGAHVKYKCQTASISVLSLNEYLALRLICACILWPDAKQALDDAEEYQQLALNQYADIQNYEEMYRYQLLPQLSSIDLHAKPITNPRAQFLFCIDNRSEVIRSAIEAQGDYQTFGVAGFFNLPIAIHTATMNRAQHPTLLSTDYAIDVSNETDFSTNPVKTVRESLVQLFESVYKGLKYNFITPVTLAEFLGPFLGLAMVWRTLKPSIKQGTVPTQHRGHIDCDTIKFADMVGYAHDMLSSIGLTDNFAPKVVICGHQGYSENNPHQKALDCGACGGNSGDVNARVMANILNRVDVREELKKRQIIIPSTTEFIAAIHHTTTDEIAFLDVEGKTSLNLLKDDLVRACEQVKRIRAKELSTSENQLAYRARNWSETRPEWALAKNASFIISPRAYSQQLDLAGRSFLHDYNYQHDKNGEILKSILLGPVQIAQWINSQYLMAAVDNKGFGSGSKVTHNITGGMGIMQGNASDLMNGIAVQSLFDGQQRLYHQPIRLFVVIVAKKTTVIDLIESTPELKRLFHNGWCHLVIHDPVTEQITVNIEES